jgi:hypothetical protein
MTLYKEHKNAGQAVPSILGLTASPVMKSSSDALDEIERTMDAICRTPTKHRLELQSHVKQPTLSCVTYGSKVDPGDPGIYTNAMDSLALSFHGLDIRQDPYINRLRTENTERSRIKLQKALQKNDTYIFNQMRSLCRKSLEIRCELGAWAADYFISATITRYLDSVGRNDLRFAAWDLAEKEFLSAALQKVELPQASPSDDIQVSEKAAKLIQVLLSGETNALGIIFVQETATVHVLRRLLSLHPLTRDRFRIGSMIGISQYGARKRDVSELNDDDAMRNLAEFRTGKLNLLIATNVLEEGIDVPACNLVICFDNPSNLKSFIQRRGRARMKESKLVLLFDTASDKSLQWQTLEAEMKKKYQDDERERKELDKLEESEESRVAPFYTKIAHAKLDFDAAKSHLEHFCAVVASRQYVDYTPYYIIQEVPYTKSTNESPLIRAIVVLPNALPLHLRRIESVNSWYSEKNACKDSAFQAFVALYEAGLVNEHLMPLKDDDLVEVFETRAPEVEVDERMDPWLPVAKAWAGSQRYRRPIKVVDRQVMDHDQDQDNQVLCEFDICLPIPIPPIQQFDVYWSKSPWIVELEGETSETATTPDYDATMPLIALAYGHRFEIKDGGQHVVKFLSREEHISIDHIASQPLTWELATGFDKPLPYLIRVDANNSVYFYEKWLLSRPSLDLVQRKNTYYIEDHPTDVPWLAVQKWPKRQDFLHPIHLDPNSRPSTLPYYAVWPVSFCSADSTPIVNAQFGSLIPSITHMIEINLVASELSNTILQSLQFRDLQLIVTSISASSAREATDYQQLEFLGDSILKLFATVSVAVNCPSLPALPSNEMY